MEIRNDTPFSSSLTVGLGPEGVACLTVVVKATFVLPPPGGRPVPAPEQRPVETADEDFAGGLPGSLRLERDTATFKPRADVALIGTAYAPGGRPVRSLDVMLRVGRLRKVLRVFGDREWIFPTRMVMVPLISEPQPFARMPLTYAHAFGGIDRRAGRGCAYNYAGKGFLGEKTRASVDGRALPNIEDPAHLITSWDDEPPPAGFCFYPAHCRPRRDYAGTEPGVAEPHPLFGLAADFRHDFYNAAHPGLQVPGYLRGDEEVELVNLTPDGPRRFRLPGVRPVVTVRVASSAAAGDGAAGGREEERELSPAAPLDTLVLLPDEGAFYQLWRAVIPLRPVQDAAALEGVLSRVREVGIRQESG